MQHSEAIPTGERIMADKRSNITTTNTVLDGGIDHVGEICNWLR
jgi:hypothetical protein